MPARQEQQIVLLGIYAFVGDGMLERLLLFEFPIGSKRVGLGTQLPEKDAGQQARVSLTSPPCFCAECDLQTGLHKMFPGDRNLCRVEVPVGKWYDHLFCHSVLSSSVALSFSLFALFSSASALYAISRSNGSL